jgi:hypothetical protein
MGSKWSGAVESAEFVVKTQPDHAGGEFHSVVGRHAGRVKAAITRIVTAAVLETHEEIFDPAVRLSVKAASMPAPAVQPALALLWKLPFMPDEISPNAPPAVP